MDFGALQRYDRDRLIAGLDLAAVAAVLGCEFNESGDKIRCPAPDHNDSDPSCNLFTGEDGKQRFHCHSCGERGDLIDLVGTVEGLDYRGTLERCADLLEDGLPAPTVSSREPSIDFDAAMKAARRIVQHDPDPLLYFLASRRLPFDIEWLRAEFDVGVDERDRIVMPHYGAGERTPRAIKWRKGEDKGSIGGSRLTALYGEQRDKSTPFVVVVEGESDTWLVSWLLKDTRADVLGLPRGAGAKVDDAWRDRLRGRNVTLLFDPDEAGRKGARRWTEALLPDVESLSVAHLPEGADACHAGLDVTRTALREATDVLTNLPVSKGRRGYLKQPSQQAAANGAGPTPLSDWTVEVLRRIEVAGEGLTYDVRLPNGREVRITSSDLLDNRALNKWAGRHGLAWTGTKGTDAADLLRLLEQDAIFVPRLNGVTLAGFHDGSFVFPEPIGSIGSEALAYVAPEINAKWEDRLALAPGTPSKSLPLLLARLHQTEVMTPLLGWVSAAPLRSLCEQFPILAVMGEAGSGKTTVVNEVLRSFGWNTGTPVTITGTTPHGVFGMIGSTNAIPVWFDEYRNHARKDTKSALDQSIRDAWDGSSALRGGIGENKSSLTSFPAIAPILVSGETAFTEQSHAERVALLSLRKTERREDALKALRMAGREGFGRLYLDWLVAALESDAIPAPPHESDRPRQVVAVCSWGYEIFRLFARQALGCTRLPKFDPTLLLREQATMTTQSPELSALREYLETPDPRYAYRLVLVEDGDVLVRVKRLHTVASSDSGIQFPGNAEALERWLTNRFPGAGYERMDSGPPLLRLPEAEQVVFPS